MIVPITVVLVGCGSKKLRTAAKAKDLYTGPLFRAGREYAESCDEWFIISARYGLLHPESVVAPYEHRLAPRAAQQWGQCVADEILCQFEGCGTIEVRILAGEDYAHPIMIGLRETATTWRANVLDVQAPLRGLSIGHRLQWFTREAKA